MNDNQRKYIREYKKEKVRRVPLDVKPEFLDDIRRAAQAAGESVNGYIKNAILQRMKKEGQV